RGCELRELPRDCCPRPPSEDWRGGEAWTAPDSRWARADGYSAGRFSILRDSFTSLVGIERDSARGYSRRGESIMGRFWLRYTGRSTSERSLFGRSMLPGRSGVAGVGMLRPPIGRSYERSAS